MRLHTFVLVDPIRQVSEAPEHPRKEHSGWIQALYYDESCEFFFSFSFLLYVATDGMINRLPL